MLGFFRRVINSKAGLVITFITLGVIALAFAAGDVTGLHPGGGGMTKTTVARVGDAAIGEAQLKQRVGDQLNQIRQQTVREGIPFEEAFCLADFAASFQRAVADVLVDHTRIAAQEIGIRQIALAGGVAANRSLRRQMQIMAEETGLSLTIPPLILCTDNAAMVAAQGYRDLLAGRFADRSLNARSSLALEESFY